MKKPSVLFITKAFKTFKRIVKALHTVPCPLPFPLRKRFFYVAQCYHFCCIVLFILERTSPRCLITVLFPSFNQLIRPLSLFFWFCFGTIISFPVSPNFTCLFCSLTSPFSRLQLSNLWTFFFLSCAISL